MAAAAVNKLAVALLATTASSLVRAAPCDEPYPPPNAPPPMAQYSSKLGAVACESDVCSTIGIELLRKGGSAADAIIGTVLCVGTIGKSNLACVLV